tara:strand:- start:1610 stop:2107 length:498 start_codon:yes stop_codon:yes gene_type:complete
MKKVDYWVSHLHLLPHPEGGYYKEMYRSDHKVSANILENGLEGDRNISTAIYFLITEGNFSAFHRIKSDEVWHFYYGEPLIVHVIDLDGSYNKLIIGLDLEKGQTPQAVVPAGAWFASESLGEYSLVGCTVSPGFDFKDFELAKHVELMDKFPEHKELISRLCRE